MLILVFLKMNEQRRPFVPSNLHKVHGPLVLLDLDWMVMRFVLYFPKISPQNIVLPKICDIIKIVEDQLWYTNAYNVQTQLWCNRAHRYIPTIKKRMNIFSLFFCTNWSFKKSKIIQSFSWYQFLSRFHIQTEKIIRLLAS